MTQNNPQLFPPERIAIQLEEIYAAQFLSYWIYFNKPCDLKFCKSKTDGLIAIVFTVDSVETLEFMKEAASKTGGRIWNLTKKNNNE